MRQNLNYASNNSLYMLHLLNHFSKLCKNKFLKGELQMNPVRITRKDIKNVSNLYS